MLPRSLIGHDRQRTQEKETKDTDHNSREHYLSLQEERTII
jgi:hypothetical protein